MPLTSGNLLPMDTPGDPPCEEQRLRRIASQNPVTPAQTLFSEMGIV